MQRKLAADRELPEPHRDVARRRDEAPVADAGHQQQLPEQQQPDRRDQVEQPLARLGGQSAHRSISARARVTSSSSTRQMSSLSCAEFGGGRQRHQVARVRERHVDDLLDAAGLRGHHHGAVAEHQRLLDRVGDVDHGLAGLLPDAHQLGLQDRAVLRVERGERLVHQQHARVGDEGARDGAALAHAAGELVRIVPAELGQADELERGLDPLGRLGAAARRASSGRSRRCSRRSSRETARSPGTPWRSRTGQPGASIVSVPLDCRSRPARMRSSVDFPQPDGPTMQTNSPGAIERSMPSSASTWPRAL